MKQRIYTIENIEDTKTLRSICVPVTVFDQRLSETVSDLLDTMREGDAADRIGVGLAAPQIGCNQRIIVLEYAGHLTEDGKRENAFPTTVLINPEVTKYSREKEIIEEGCLSVPKLYGPVERPSKIRVHAKDVNGKQLNLNASGYFARVLQHEMDHLDGILYIDKVPKDKLYEQRLTDHGDKVEYE